MVFFNFLNFFAIFFNLLLRVRQEMIGTIIFILTPSRPVPTCVGLKKCRNGVFQFLKLFLLFFFFNYLLGVGLEIIGTIIFILTLSRPFPTQFCLARCHNGVFLIFWLFFLEFSIQGRVRNDRNDNFYFHSFLTFPNQFGLEKKRLWRFLVF